MTTTNKKPSRGRPRRFDPDQVVAIAQDLFHTRGYDAVSVADVTDALGINAPSFYGVFGSKAELYTRVLYRYAETGAIPISDLLRHDRLVSESLTALLEDAARRYAGNDTFTGCLVLEGTRCNDPSVRDAANVFYMAAENTIHRFIETQHPQDARRLTDFVSTIMSGMSYKARQGHSVDQLLATAHLAGLALTQWTKD